VLALQRQAGNRAVQALIARRTDPPRAASLQREPVTAESTSQRERVNALPQRIRELLAPGGAAIAPEDYGTVLRIAEKLEGFSEDDWVLYQRRIDPTTRGYERVEASVNRFLSRQKAEREVLSRVEGTESLYQQVKSFKERRQELLTPQHGTDRLLIEDPLFAAEYEAARASLQRNLENADFADVADYDAACGAYLGVFRARAVELTLLALRASEQVAEAELARYGRAEESADLFARLTKMRALVKESNEARDWSMPSGVETFPVNPFQEQMLHEAAEKSARAEAERWGQAERNPILKDPQLRTQALNVASVGELADVLRENAEARLADIRKTRANVLEDPDLVFKLDKIVALTLQELGASSGSIGDLIVKDHQQDISIRELVFGLALAALAIGLGLLTFGGGAVAIIAGGAGVLVSAYSFAEELDKYATASAAAHTAFDPELAVSSEEPTAVWAALALVGVGLDSAALVRALRAAGPALRVLDATNDVAKFEDELAKAVGLSDQLQTALGNAARAEVEYRAAARELSKGLQRLSVTTGMINLDPDVLAKAVKAAYFAAKKGLRTFEHFLADLRAQKFMRAIDFNKLTPEQIRQLQDAWYSGSQQVGLGARRGAGGSTGRAPTVIGNADPRTAGTGGISSISKRVNDLNETVVEIEGKLQTPIFERAINAPNYNLEKQWGYLRLEHDLRGWQAAHLWGPGFGDEAAEGIMLAPREANLVWQNAKIEKFLRDMHRRAFAEGAEIQVRAVARSHPRTVSGGAMLQEAEYTFFITKHGATPKKMGRFSFLVDPPPGGTVHEPSLTMFD
jgi:hypothetical protein